MDKTRYGTWDEWKELGYHIKKGEKSGKRYNGVAVFSEFQVEKTVPNVKYDTPLYYDDGEEWDEFDIDFQSAFGDR